MMCIALKLSIQLERQPSVVRQDLIPQKLTRQVPVKWCVVLLFWQRNMRHSERQRIHGQGPVKVFRLVVVILTAVSGGWRGGIREIDSVAGMGNGLPNVGGLETAIRLAGAEAAGAAIRVVMVQGESAALTAVALPAFDVFPASTLTAHL